MTAEEYLERALDWSRHAIALRNEYGEKYGDSTGTHGKFNRFPLSGGICEHWPRDKKDNVLRAVCTRQNMIEESLDAWKATGRRRVTWLRLKDQILGNLSVSC